MIFGAGFWEDVKEDTTTSIPWEIMGSRYTTATLPHEEHLKRPKHLLGPSA